MIALIFGYWIGQVLAPFLIVGLILWFIYELIFNFWATMEVVVGFIAMILGWAWDIASGIFMYVWDITLVGPILAIGGTLFLLRFFFAPVLTVLFYVCAVPIVFLVHLILNIPKGGMTETKENNPENTSTTENVTTIENTTSNN